MSTAGRTLGSWLRQIILARCANGVIKAEHWETTLPHTTITQKVFSRLPADTFILMLLPMHHTTTLQTETRSSLRNHSLLCHERSFCALTSSTECKTHAKNCVHIYEPSVPFCTHLSCVKLVHGGSQGHAMFVREKCPDDAFNPKQVSANTMHQFTYLMCLTSKWILAMNC